MALVTPASPSPAPGLPEYPHHWALVDVETSGRVARRDRVLSVAVITLGPDGLRTGEFATLVDPGPDCDPGPVEVHGLTRERLRGAPAFADVAGRIAELLQDRVLVAHNAQFDYDFLAHEFARARQWLPVAQRLCTLALNRRVDPPTADLRLGTLAAHYGVPRHAAHDALDDTRVLAGILRATLREAGRLDLPLPLVSCPPRQDARFAPQPPKTPCPYSNPGRYVAGGQLVQGMKVAVTGETATARAELVARSVAAGLNVMSTVSRHTSLLVANDWGAATSKARKALEHGVPVVDESTFLRLLGGVREGDAHEPGPGGAAGPPFAEPLVAPVVLTDPPDAARGVPGPRTPADDLPAPAAGPAPARPAAPPRRPGRRVAGPLAGRRVLVLGGTHPQASAARVRVVELGAAAAVNLSASVTDVVLLPGGEQDRRMRRITALAVPTHPAHWLDAPTPPAGAGERRTDGGQGPQVLPRGGVVDLVDPSATAGWQVTAAWGQQSTCEIDLVAFLVDEEDQVARDENFVFYSAPESPDGAVRLCTDGPTEQSFVVDTAALPAAVRKVIVAAAIDGEETFGAVGAVQFTVGPGGGAEPLAQAVLDAATTERTMLVAEVYRRGPLWRCRAVGQGYDHGLAELAVQHGVDVAED
ncbi:TerD family protein [Streptomyces sp. NPDC004111]|uniref:TerD family protein n=1 Tax=Streptomyces sp. NPDC004111 TaxID=3364690 RepID=UPI0036C1C4F5